MWPNLIQEIHSSNLSQNPFLSKNCEGVNENLLTLAHLPFLADSLAGPGLSLTEDLPCTLVATLLTFTSCVGLFWPLSSHHLSTPTKGSPELLGFPAAGWPHCVSDWPCVQAAWPSEAAGEPSTHPKQLHGEGMTMGSVGSSPDLAPAGLQVATTVVGILTPMPL
jgi:hypothetical protein